MIAVDTNLIVRYLTGDHPEQSARAQALVRGEGGINGSGENAWVRQFDDEGNPMPR